MADHDSQGLHQEFEFLKSVELRKNELIQVHVLEGSSSSEALVVLTMSGFAQSYRQIKP